MSKWITFTELPDLETRSRKRKTRIWRILTKDGATALGHVRWFSHWRCYAFWPHPNTLYEPTCLRDIADFCTEQTAASRAEATARRIEHRARVATAASNLTNPAYCVKVPGN